MIYSFLSVAGIFSVLGNLTLAVVRNARIKVHAGVAVMNLLGRRQKQLRFLTADAEREPPEYLLQGMRKVLGEETPEEDAVRTCLKEPDRSATLRMEQQMVAMDKLLECAVVNLRMLCNLICCQQLKDAGAVNSVEGFLRLVRFDDVYNGQKENAD